MTKTQRAKAIALDPKTLTAIIVVLLGALGVETSDTIRTGVGLPSKLEADAEPRAVIKADKSYQVGDLIILDAEQSVGTHFRWSVRPEDNERPTFWVDPDKPLILHLASRPGTYLVTLTASNCNGNTDQTIPVVVEGTVPGPPADPNPPGDPDPPPVPDGKYGLNRFAYQQALKVPSDYRSYATQIDALVRKLLADDQLKNSNDFAAAFVAGLKQILTTEDSLTAWRPWYNATRDRLIELETQNKFASYGDYQTAWTEISGGLKRL